MKKIILVLLFLSAFVPQAMAEIAFKSDIQVLDRREIAKLTDDQLVDKYLDTEVEVEANKSFHATSGFGPEDFKSFKDILKFRLLLLMEIHGRNLELPQFNH